MYMHTTRARLFASVDLDMLSSLHVRVLVLHFFYLQTVSSQNKFLGCYPDNGNNRALTGHVSVWRGYLTKQRCLDLCYRMGFAYAGLEISLECFCGNEKPVGYRVDNSDCIMPCSGDPSALECGGRWKIAVYETDFPNNNTYVGCYRDSQKNRLLTGYKGQWQTTMTKQNCITHCFKLGFLHAGLEVSIECFCGDEEPYGHSLSPDSCNYKCSGDNSLECGGNWIAAIYKTEIPNESIEGKYVGCFKDDGDQKVLNRHHVTLEKTNSPRRCVNICTKLGFTYAGVENGKECHCGDSRPLELPVDNGQCNSQCSGDSSEKCGGNKVTSVYSSEPQPIKNVYGGATSQNVYGGATSQNVYGGTTTSKKKEFLGCYPDRSKNRVLTDHFVVWKGWLTKQRCIDYCYRMGYAYAGVEAGEECFCGNEADRVYAASDSDCNMPCDGDLSALECGGHWRVGLYSTDFPNNNTYVGCYQDSQENRLLTGHKVQWATTMTKQNCISHCFQLGYLYAGLEASIECFCGDEKPVGYPMSSDDCKFECSGNKARECGGNWIAAIYKTEIPNESIEGKYVGCFKDDGDQKVLNRHHVTLEKTNSPHRCFNICAKLGFTYAGVENGKECHCGGSRPLELPVDDGQCNSQCSGDSSEKCGGNKVTSVYSSEPQPIKNVFGGATTSQNEFLGCYPDKINNRVLTDHFVVWKGWLTKQRCIDYCYRIGYAYAGVEAGEECFCGNEADRVYAASDSDCNMPCDGDLSALECGGHWRVGLYSTDFPNNNTYVGCYQDSQENRLLTGHKVQWPTTMTKQNCISHCFQLGFHYAGLEASIECFCGDEEPIVGYTMSSDDCKSICSGNNARECGGNGIAAIYKTEIPNESIEDKYVGCFKDEGDQNILNRHHVTLEKTNSPRRCFNICAKLGFPYAGVKNGKECNCGDSRPLGLPIRATQCNFQCSGDTSAKCGGINFISVYSTEDQSSFQENKFLGCFPDRSDNRLLKGHVVLWRDSLTKKSCIDLCYNMGFRYAALEISIECFCGNKRPRGYHINPDECNYPCSGDESSKVCGGNWKGAVYETNFPEDNMLMGCYADSADDRKLTGTKEEWSNNLTKIDCISHCFKLGYLYAGLEASTECYCGDEKPSHYHLSPDDCKGKCSGDDTKECGGNNRIAIYKTEIPDKPETGKYIGCFRDTGRRKLLNRHRVVLEKTNSPRRCLNICTKLGYGYSGVENGNECFCGVSRPLGSPLADSDCDLECPGDGEQKCGAYQAIRVYRTGDSEDVDPLQDYFKVPSNEEPVVGAPAVTISPVIIANTGNCESSVTSVNGRSACKGKLVFNELFDNPLQTNVWKYLIQMADAPDYEFVLYHSSHENIYVNNGLLTIKPILQSDGTVRHGKIDFGSKCTGDVGSKQCVSQAWSYLILPPVTSAKISTSRSFSFRYGKIEIRARFPKGDWIVPELLLEPKYLEYGPGYRSGRIRIAMVRGNKELTCEGRSVGNTLTCEAIASASFFSVKSHSVESQNGNWKDGFHDYTLTWTPDKMTFSVDGQSEQTLIPQNRLASEMLGFDSDEQKTWQYGSRMAPFDREFYISIGLAVGGIRDFPDKCSNKPWRNFELKQVLNFWRAKHDWLPTWERPTLEIDHIKVTAL